ncbi:hypothetical protein OROHE_001239 [Orobanche hederae]
MNRKEVLMKDSSEFCHLVPELSTPNPVPFSQLEEMAEIREISIEEDQPEVVMGLKQRYKLARQKRMKLHKKRGAKDKRMQWSNFILGINGSGEWSKSRTKRRGTKKTQ